MEESYWMTSRIRLLPVDDMRRLSFSYSERGCCFPGHYYSTSSILPKSSGITMTSALLPCVPLFEMFAVSQCKKLESSIDEIRDSLI